MLLTKTIKRTKKKYELKFTHKDMQGVDAPHNGALVLTVNINIFYVKRILIDPSSSSEIMYHSIFKKLKLPAMQVRSADAPMFSFSGEAVWPIAFADVPIRLGPI